MKILVIRLSAMGDVALALPVLKALLQQNKQVEVTLLTRSAFVPIFANIPRLTIFSPDLKKRHSGMRGIFRLFNDVRAEHNFDMVVDLHDVLRAKILRSLFALMSVAVFKINKGKKEKQQLTRRTNKGMRQLVPAYMRYADVFREAGFSLDFAVAGDYMLHPSGNIPEKLNVYGPPPFVGIAPFAQHEGKIYPVELMTSVIASISERYKVFIFGGGVAERQQAEKWEADFENVFSVIGNLSLAEELILMKQLKVMLAMDSANMHLAAICGSKTVSVWGATHPFVGFVPFGNHQHTFIQADLPCRPCSTFGGNPCYRRDYVCMRSITPETIVKVVLEQIKNV